MVVFATQLNDDVLAAAAVCNGQLGVLTSELKGLHKIASLESFISELKDATQNRQLGVLISELKGLHKIVLICFLSVPLYSTD